VQRLCVEPFEPAACCCSDDPVSHVHQHARSTNWQGHSKHFHVYKNCRPPRSDRDRTSDWVEPQQRRVYVFVVATVAQRMATVGIASLVSACWPGTARACVADVAWTSDGWTTVRAVRVEQCHFHRGRSARSG